MLSVPIALHRLSNSYNQEPVVAVAVVTPGKFAKTTLEHGASAELQQLADMQVLSLNDGTAPASARSSHGSYVSHSLPVALDSMSGMLTAFAEPPPVKPGPRALAHAMPFRTTSLTPHTCPIPAD